MQTGEIIGNRFMIEELAGSGGMGHVYRARDRQTGELVAVKVLHEARNGDLGRFAREAETLASIRLPGIVRYVAHGTTTQERPYLAMEWLTGKTLTERLGLRALSIAESVGLAFRVATTLGMVHRLGIVHRDLKPSNLLLVDGALDRVKVIDFGLARATSLGQQLTVPGVVLGTPSYMAPEQARGQPGVDARADVFALGCVLYKCLTGRAAFQGTSGLAILAKVILEEPPRLRELRGDIPDALDALVARMLSKSPEARPPNGEAVAAGLAVLAELDVEAVSIPAIPSSRVYELTTEERRVMCLVVASIPGETLSEDEETLSLDQIAAPRTELMEIAEHFGGTLEMLDGTSPLIMLSGAFAPTDLAARAARCALLLLNTLPQATPIAVVTGRAKLAARLPVGEVIDRAAQLLPPPGTRAIHLDEVTAALLGARFDVVEENGKRRLLDEREEPEAPPQLLGKTTACVGRDRELALLAGELAHCRSEPTSAFVLVTGAAGMGKSRLRHEIIRRLRERGEAVELWLGKADPMSAGSAFHTLASALRRGLGLLEGETLEVRRRKIRDRVARHRELDEGRVAAFLGELVGTPFPDEHDVQLRTARRNPMLMSDQLRLAWEEFVQAECKVRTVLLVLEDLHWGDLPTVKLVDAALRHLQNMPFTVLALGRPELRKIFPKLWDGHRGQELRLTPLPRRACEQLVRKALGDDVSTELVDMLIERADGNAFYLEEQIRAVATGNTSALPETVLAMVQAGLEALDPEARRLLRAASIFGESFTPSGVAALAGGASVAQKLAELAGREVLVRRSTGGTSGEPEYRFRHALVREAAYGMLTERDREAGHALAGAYLAQLDDADPMALAEHFERGGEQARAASHYLRAAQQALRGNDLGAAIERAERGAVCSAEPPVVGALRLAQAEAHRWRGEFSLAEQRGLAAAERLAPGSAAWFSAVTQVAIATGKLGRYELLEHWAGKALATDAEDDAALARHICLGEGVLYLSFGGRYAVADTMVEAIERATSDRSALEVEVAARLEQARAFRTQQSDLGVSLRCREAVLDAFERAGDRRNACMARTNLGYVHAELGDFEGAEAALRGALAAAQRMDLPNVVASVLNNLGLVLACRARLGEARAVEEEAIQRFEVLGDPRMVGGSRIYLAVILLLAGDAEAAEREASAAVGLLDAAPPLLAHAVAVQARARTALGRVEEGLGAAEKAMQLLASFGAEEGESLVRLVHAEALSASGRRDEARAALAAARDHLLARAEKISDPAWRERFLHRVPDNARTLELYLRWSGALAGA